MKDKQQALDDMETEIGPGGSVVDVLAMLVDRVLNLERRVQELEEAIKAKGDNR